MTYTTTAATISATTAKATARPINTPLWRATPPAGAAPELSFADVVAESAARALVVVPAAGLALVLAAGLEVVSVERAAVVDATGSLVTEAAVVRLPVVSVAVVLRLGVGGTTCTLESSNCCSSGGSERMYSATFSITAHNVSIHIGVTNDL